MIPQDVSQRLVVHFLLFMASVMAMRTIYRAREHLPDAWRTLCPRKIRLLTLSIAVAAAITMFVVTHKETQPVDSETLLLIAITSIIFSPVGEEFVYRGLILGWGLDVCLKKFRRPRTHNYIAFGLLVISSVVFGISHYESLYRIIKMTLIGFVLGGLYLWSGRNLATPMLAHFTFNLLVVINSL